MRGPNKYANTLTSTVMPPKTGSGNDPDLVNGQFSIYLRLLDVPAPGSYGPTAEEQA